MGRAAQRVFAKTMKDWQETKLFVVIDWVKMVSEETSDFISPVLGLIELKYL